MNLCFVAEGIPKGQPRARAFYMKDKGVRMFDPSTAEGWKSQVAVAGRGVLPEIPIEGPIILTLTFFFPRPKSHYGSGKKASTLKDSAPKFHIGKPDADNLAKAVMDAMTQLGFWKDDAQVWCLGVFKYFATEKPGCRVDLSYQPPTQLKP